MTLKELKESLNKSFEGTFSNEKHYTKSIHYKTVYYMDSELNNYEDKVNTNIRYAMLCYYDDMVDESEVENLKIIIGQNPSFSFKDNIDETNQNILKVIKDSLQDKIYLMFNTFPMICSKGEKAGELLLDTTMQPYIYQNIAFFNKLINKFNEKKFSYTLIASFGSNSVCKAFLLNLKKLNIALKSFSYETIIVPHMSYQQANSLSRATNKYELIDCKIDYDPADLYYARIEK